MAYDQPIIGFPIVLANGRVQTIVIRDEYTRFEENRTKMLHVTLPHTDDAIA